MSTNYRFSDSKIPHFITCTLVEWVNLLDRSSYKDIIIDSLKYCIENKGLIVYAYVIMSNHIHLIVCSKNDEELSKTIRSFKRHTAKILYSTLKNDNHESRRNWIFDTQGKKSPSNTHYQIWRHENHPITLDNKLMMNQRLNYIHENPVRAKLCFRAEDYMYSSAPQYYGEKGDLPIEFIG